MHAGHNSDAFYVFKGVSTSFAQFNRLVGRRARQLARWRGQVIALWADHEPSYPINLFATWKAGAIPLLVSRRLPEATVLALLERASARALVTPAGGGPYPVAVLDPAGDGPGQEGPDESDADIGSEEQEVALLLHTSGTTGLPKLVPVTRANLRASLALQLDCWQGHWSAGDGSVGTLPLYHAFGLVSQLLCCYRLKGRYYFCGSSPLDMLDLLEREQGRITHLFSVPWLLEQLLAVPTGLARLQALRYVVVGGAPLGEDIGDRLAAAGVRVVQNYGMTETGCAFMSPLAGGDWRDLFPVIPKRFWHLDGSGTLVIRADCPTLSPICQGDYSTQDVLQRGPSGGYRHLGRHDDIVVHATGEKSSAAVIEQMLLSRLRDLIDRCAFLASGRLRPVCVLQLKRQPDAADRAAVFAALEQTNADLPGHSRLHRDMVLLLAPGEKRLPVTAKGTVMRRQAEVDLEAELAALDAGAASAAGPTLESFFAQSGRLDRHVSLFEQGLDSLTAAALALHVARLAPQRQAPLNIVYQYPTLEQLEKYLEGDQMGPERTPPTFPAFSPAELAAARLDYYPPRHVLLTGASGFIGAELVEALLECRHVESVSCLVRATGPGLRAHPRVRYYGGYHFADDRLGLARRDYEKLSGRVDTVIHAAWPVEFNAPYARLADATLSSVRHLIEFARRGNKALHFLSSVATVMLHPGRTRVAEEWPAPTCETCLPHGYAQAKWEAEHLVIRSGLRHKVFRLGQISAHRETLRWNANEHIPIILAASLGLGSVPVLPLPIDWVPVDVACRAVVELLSAAGMNIHHVANPRPRPAECLAVGSRPLPLDRWMAEAQPQLDRYPRLGAIWPFLSEVRASFERIRPLDAQASCAHSPTLAACEAIGDDYILALRNRFARS
jgi:acyl-coenzyme A synthetase/AMP-(fatty) acid ligase/nucleoside-diphosphate-sugar epimerase